MTLRVDNDTKPRLQANGYSVIPNPADGGVEDTAVKPVDRDFWTPLGMTQKLCLNPTLKKTTLLAS
jgi:hypothetical protein